MNKYGKGEDDGGAVVVGGEDVGKVARYDDIDNALVDDRCWEIARQ